MDKEEIMSKYKIIALYGESGAGKDTIQNWLVDLLPEETNKIISCTTRPPREHETNGYHYNFCSKEEFLDKLESGDILEYSVFNGWYYGTSKKDLTDRYTNIGVFNPTSIRSCLKMESVMFLSHTCGRMIKRGFCDS